MCLNLKSFLIQWTSFFEKYKNYEYESDFLKFKNKDEFYFIQMGLQPTDYKF